MQIFLQTLIGGIGFGAIYALVALGFTLVYRTMGLVNFAHGDIAMVGAYIATTFYISTKLPFAVAMASAIICTAVVGLVGTFAFDQTGIGVHATTIAIITNGKQIAVK